MKTKTFVDIDPNFTANPVTGDIMTNNDTRAILFAVKNLVLTNFYERLFHSEIGSPVNQLLFDLVDDPQFSIVIRRTILDVLKIYEPRVDVEDVVVLDSPDNNKVYVKVHVKVKNTLTQLKANIILERTR